MMNRNNNNNFSSSPQLPPHAHYLCHGAHPHTLVRTTTNDIAPPASRSCSLCRANLYVDRGEYFCCISAYQYAQHRLRQGQQMPQQQQQQQQYCSFAICPKCAAVHERPFSEPQLYIRAPFGPEATLRTRPRPDAHILQTQLEPLMIYESMCEGAYPKSTPTAAEVMSAGGVGSGNRDPVAAASAAAAAIATQFPAGEPLPYLRLRWGGWIVQGDVVSFDTVITQCNWSSQPAMRTAGSLLKQLAQYHVQKTQTVYTNQQMMRHYNQQQQQQQQSQQQSQQSQSPLSSQQQPPQQYLQPPELRQAPLPSVRVIEEAAAAAMELMEWKSIARVELERRKEQRAAAMSAAAAVAASTTTAQRNNNNGKKISKPVRATAASVSAASAASWNGINGGSTNNNNKILSAAAAGGNSTNSNSHMSAGNNSNSNSNGAINLNSESENSNSNSSAGNVMPSPQSSSSDSSNSNSNSADAVLKSSEEGTALARQAAQQQQQQQQQKQQQDQFAVPAPPLSTCYTPTISVSLLAADKQQQFVLNGVAPSGCNVADPCSPSLEPAPVSMEAIQRMWVGVVLACYIIHPAVAHMSAGAQQQQQQTGSSSSAMSSQQLGDSNAAAPRQMPQSSSSSMPSLSNSAVPPAWVETVSRCVQRLCSWIAMMSTVLSQQNSAVNSSVAFAAAAGLKDTAFTLLSSGAISFATAWCGAVKSQYQVQEQQQLQQQNCNNNNNNNNNTTSNGLSYATTIVMVQRVHLLRAAHCMRTLLACAKESVCGLFSKEFVAEEVANVLRSTVSLLDLSVVCPYPQLHVDGTRKGVCHALLKSVFFAMSMMRNSMFSGAGAGASAWTIESPQQRKAAFVGKAVGADEEAGAFSPAKNISTNSNSDSMTATATMVVELPLTHFSHREQMMSIPPIAVLLADATCTDAERILLTQLHHLAHAMNNKNNRKKNSSNSGSSVVNNNDDDENDFSCGRGGVFSLADLEPAVVLVTWLLPEHVNVIYPTAGFMADVLAAVESMFLASTATPSSSSSGRKQRQLAREEKQQQLVDMDVVELCMRALNHRESQDREGLIAAAARAVRCIFEDSAFLCAQYAAEMVPTLFFALDRVAGNSSSSSSSSSGDLCRHLVGALTVFGRVAASSFCRGECAGGLGGSAAHSMTRAAGGVGASSSSSSSAAAGLVSLSLAPYVPTTGGGTIPAAAAVPQWRIRQRAVLDLIPGHQQQQQQQKAAPRRPCSRIVRVALRTPQSPILLAQQEQQQRSSQLQVQGGRRDDAASATTTLVATCEECADRVMRLRDGACSFEQADAATFVCPTALFCPMCTMWEEKQVQEMMIDVDADDEDERQLLELDDNQQNQKPQARRPGEDAAYYSEKSSPVHHQRRLKQQQQQQQQQQETATAVLPPSLLRDKTVRAWWMLNKVDAELIVQRWMHDLPAAERVARDMLWELAVLMGNGTGAGDEGVASRQQQQQGTTTTTATSGTQQQQPPSLTSTQPHSQSSSSQPQRRSSNVATGNNSSNNSHSGGARSRASATAGAQPAPSFFEQLQEIARTRTGGTALDLRHDVFASVAASHVALTSAESSLASRPVLVAARAAIRRFVEQRAQAAAAASRQQLQRQQQRLGTTGARSSGDDDEDDDGDRPLFQPPAYSSSSNNNNMTAKRLSPIRGMGPDDSVCSSAEFLSDASALVLSDINNASYASNNQHQHNNNNSMTVLRMYDNNESVVSTDSNYVALTAGNLSTASFQNHKM